MNPKITLTQEINPTIIREFPNAKHDFLRYQIGLQVMRNEQIPVFDDKRIVGYRTGTNLVPVFQLMGFGSTLQKAERSANLEPFSAPRPGI